MSYSHYTIQKIVSFLTFEDFFDNEIKLTISAQTKNQTKTTLLTILNMPDYFCVNFPGKKDTIIKVAKKTKFQKKQINEKEYISCEKHDYSGIYEIINYHFFAFHENDKNHINRNDIIFFTILKNKIIIYEKRKTITYDNIFNYVNSAFSLFELLS